MIRFLILLVGLATSGELWAGQRVGNGGSVVACARREPVVLDFYEASLPRLGSSISPPLIALPSTSDEVSVAHFLVARLARFRPLNSSLLKLSRSLALAEAAVGSPSSWTAVPLPPYRDSGEPYELFPGCVRLQAVIRTETGVFADPAVWKRLNVSQKGILLFHEWVYWIAAGTGHSDSQEVRQVVRAALSETSGTKESEDLSTRAALGVLTPVDREVSAPADEVLKPEFYEDAAIELGKAVCSRPVTAAQAVENAQRMISHLEKYETLLVPKSEAAIARDRALAAAYEIKREAANEPDPGHPRRYCADE